MDVRQLFDSKFNLITFKYYLYLVFKSRVLFYYTFDYKHTVNVYESFRRFKNDLHLIIQSRTITRIFYLSTSIYMLDKKKIQLNKSIIVGILITIIFKLAYLFSESIIVFNSSIHYMNYYYNLYYLSTIKYRY